MWATAAQVLPPFLGFLLPRIKYKKPLLWDLRLFFILLSCILCCFPASIMLREHPTPQVLSSAHQPLAEPFPSLVTALSCTRWAGASCRQALAEIGRDPSTASSHRAITWNPPPASVLQIWEGRISPYGNRDMCKVQVKCWEVPDENKQLAPICHRLLQLSVIRSSFPLWERLLVTLHGQWNVGGM